jgi:hypothetical protein
MYHPHASGAWNVALRAGSVVVVIAAVLAALGFTFNSNYFTEPARGQGVVGVIVNTPTPAEAAEAEIAKAEAAKAAIAAKLPPQTPESIVVDGKTVAARLRNDVSSVPNDIAIVGDVTDYYQPGLTVVVGKIASKVVGVAYPVPYGETCTNIAVSPPIKGDIDVIELYRVINQRVFDQWLADR